MSEPKKVKKNSTTLNSGKIIAGGITIVALLAVLAVLVACAFIKGFTDGKPPKSEHIADAPIDKKDSVTVTADSDGSALYVVDKVYITNNPEKDTITDYCNLDSVYNSKQKSNQPYRINDNKLRWTTGGNDVTYSGVADPDDLPFTVSIKYYLNGNQIDPDELNGKTGDLKIAVKYHNNISVELENGKEIPVPYVVTAMIVAGEDFTDIKVTNGKSLNAGGNELAIGVNLPSFDKLSKSGLFGIASDEVIFTGRINNFAGATMQFFVGGDIVSQLDPKIISELDIDDVVVDLTAAANKVIFYLGKYYPYVDKVSDTVPKIASVSGNIRTVTNDITVGLIELLQNLDKEQGTVNGTFKLLEGVMDEFYESIFGSEEEGEDGEDGIEGSLAGLEEFFVGGDEEGDIGVVEELADTIEVLQLAIDNTEDAEFKAECQEQIDELYESIKELDPDSEYLPVEMREDGPGLIDEYEAAMSALEELENLFSNPDVVKEYFDTTQAELEEELAAASSSEDKASIQEELEGLANFKKKCIKEDGSFYTLEELDEMGIVASELMGTIIQDNLDPEIKNRIIGTINKVNETVNNVDGTIQKINKMMPGLTKKIKKIVSKVYEIYDTLMYDYIATYNSELKGTVKALKKSIEAHRQVHNFSGLTEGWTGATTYTYSLTFGGEKTVFEIIDVKGVVDELTGKEKN